jgi:hypothetical protein
MRIKLHYAELNNQGYIPCIEFENIQELIDNIPYEPKDCIYLFTYSSKENKATDFSDEVIVTEDIFHIESFIKTNRDELIGLEMTDFFLQEYPSYEEAYKVALMMKETSPLCYNK